MYVVIKPKVCCPKPPLKTTEIAADHIWKIPRLKLTPLMVSFPSPLASWSPNSTHYQQKQTLLTDHISQSWPHSLSIPEPNFYPCCPFQPISNPLRAPRSIPPCLPSRPPLLPPSWLELCPRCYPMRRPTYPPPHHPPCSLARVLINLFHQLKNSS